MKVTIRDEKTMSIEQLAGCDYVGYYSYGEKYFLHHCTGHNALVSITRGGAAGIHKTERDLLKHAQITQSENAEYHVFNTRNELLEWLKD